MVRVATTPKFPTTLLTLADVGLFTNREDADLVQDETSATTTLHFDDASAFAVGMWLSSLSVDGFELVRVTAVDLAQNTVTVVRSEDGTVAVAHKQGQTWKATFPAKALNQIRDELIAHAAFLGVDGECIHWDRGLELEPSSDTCAILTLNLRSARTNKKFISFKHDDVETGAMLYDTANDAVEFQGIRVDIGSGADLLIEDNRLIRLGTDSDAQIAFDSADNRVEWRSDVLTRWQKVDATELVTIDPTVPALIANAVTRARTDNATDLGTVDVRWRGLYLGPSSLHVLNAASDANDVLHAGSAGFQMGAGGASALDVTLVRQAASIYKVIGNLAGDVRLGMDGAASSMAEFRLATTDAEPALRLDSQALISFGLGGVTATDTFLNRIDPSRLAIAGSLAGSIKLGMTGAAAPDISLHLASADANPASQWLKDRISFGAGGASVLDTVLARQTASVLEHTGNLAGSVRYGMSGAATPFLALRAAAADAEPLAALLTDRLALGAGGATVTDYEIVRTGANTGTLSGHLRPVMDNTYDFGSSLERLNAIIAMSHLVYAGPGDALPMAKLGTLGFEMGPGGGPGLDVAMDRRADSMWQIYGSLAGDVRLGMTGANLPVVDLRVNSGQEPDARLDSVGLHFGPGNVTVPDYALIRTGVNTGTLSGHLLPSTDSAYDLGSDPVRWRNGYFDNLVVTSVTTGHILPASDNTFDLGSPDFRWRDVYASGSSFRVISTVGDANPTARLGTALLAFGAGGASPTDVQYARQAASIVELTGDLAGSVRYGLSGAATPFLALRAAAADANPLVGLTTTGFEIGAGGASVVDVIWARTGAGANKLTGPVNGDIRFSVASAQLPFISMRKVTTDANPFLNIRNTAIEFGNGGGSTLDITLSRQAASVLELTGNVAGSVRSGMSGANAPFLALRNAAADANAAALLVKAGLNLGAGGASAADLFVERVVPTANILFHIGDSASGADGVWIDVTTPGIILQSPDADYWRITIDNTGAVVTTSLGASLP